MNNVTPALRYACDRGDVEAAKKMLQYHPTIINDVDHLGCTSLMSACGAGREAIVKLLLEHNADTNIVDKEGSSALIYACRGGEYGFLNIVKLLLTYKDINMDASHINSHILRYAAERTSSYILNFLLSHDKIDKNKKVRNNQTFFYALLLDNKGCGPCQLNCFKNLGETEKRNFLNHQLYENIDVSEDRADFFHRMNAFIAGCIRYGADLNQRNENGKRPLDVAWDNYYYLEQKATNGEVEVKDVLRKRKAQIVRSFIQNTPHISDPAVYYCLKKQEMPNDIIGVIFRHYYTVTIERVVMVTPIVFGHELFDMEKIKNELLTEKLQTLRIKG
jgi:hypothetical protein